MSKERELLEKLTTTYFEIEDRGHACPLDEVEIESLMKAARELLETKPAPQSESEAVRLLRNTIEFLRVEAATLERLSLDGYYDQGTWMRMAGTFAKDIRGNIAQLEKTLSRPPGPDWRTLAEKAWDGWQSAQMTKPMYAIRDALASEAAATGKDSGQ